MYAILIILLAATDILLGVESLGIFWGFFCLVIFRDFFNSINIVDWSRVASWLGIVSLLMIFSSVVNGIPKATSLGYAVMFLLYGFWLMISAQNFDKIYLVRCFLFVIFCYSVSIFLATALIYFGIYDLNDYLFARVYFDLLGGDMRPIGFSSEPSYAAFILALSWMALVRLGFLSQERRKIILNWTICVLVALQLLGSIYGYLLSFIIIATMVKIFPDYRKYTFIASAVTAALLFLGVNFDNGGRFFNILTAIFSGSMDEWRSEDFSSFFRFGPFVIYLRESDFLNYHAWIGYGATSAAYFFGNIFQEHVVSDQMAIELGFIPSYLYDYGLICAIVFLVFLYLISYGDHRFAMVLMLILLLFNANFNTQIIWFAITCSYVSMRKQF